MIDPPSVFANLYPKLNGILQKILNKYLLLKLMRYNFVKINTNYFVLTYIDP